MTAAASSPPVQTAGAHHHLASLDVKTPGELLGHALARAQGQVPCLTGNGSLWLSESPDDRSAAAVRCQDCPVIIQCRAYAASVRPRLTFGVYAGVDHTPRAYLRKGA